MSDVPEHVAEGGCDNELDYTGQGNRTYGPAGAVRLPVNRRQTGPTGTENIHRILQTPDFSSVVRQMPGYSMQSRGTTRTPLPQAWRLHLSA